MYKFKNKDVVCFYGDSITHDGSWISKIFDYYYSKENIKFEVYNWGVGGNNCIKAINRIDKILELNPTVVVIMFGMNDVNYTLYGNSCDTKEILNLKEKCINDNINVLNKICEIFKNKNIKVIMCTPTSYDEISDSKGINYKGTNKGLKIFSNKVIEIAKQFNFDVCDFNSITLLAQQEAIKIGESYIKEDRIHPSIIGHELMARYFLKEQGFNIDFTYDYLKNKEYSLIPSSDIEKERRNLEIVFKSTHYPKYDYFYYAKSDKEITTLINKELKNDEAFKNMPKDAALYIKNQFIYYLENYKNSDINYLNYINFIKKIVED